ncbi:MAG: aminotransferase class V-fold PLP-dependent enzyme [Clostridia bacterium]|nr:aminotransferase class V-fold PLP-dependent enzyme [Clostridia bacterium]
MIYFDNAATSFPKPEGVIGAMSRCMKEYCGNPGRSGHIMSARAAEAVYDARCEAAELFGADKPENVIFTHNATHAINLAVGGYVRGLHERGERQHLLISNLEHNSVSRLINRLKRECGISCDVFNAVGDEKKVAADIRSKLRPYTKAVVCTGASNVAPIVLPVGRIGALCRENGLAFFLDASQTAGLYDINMNRDGITALCAPGHKALYGPQGSGLAVFCDDFDFSVLSPLIFGGNGVNSYEQEMGYEQPESFEAGTVAVPNIVGLREGIRFVRGLGTDYLREKEERVCRYLKSEFGNMRGVRLVTPEAEGCLVSLLCDVKTPTRLAEELGSRGFCMRAGMHCAPLAHETLKTGGDALRISPGAFSNVYEAEKLVDETAKLLKMT